jgi:hypothetical protein
MKNIGDKKMQIKNLNIGLRASVLTVGLVLAAFSLQGIAATDPYADLFIKGAMVTPGAKKNTACIAGEKYVAWSDNGHYELIGSLFTNDASFSGPNNEEMIGGAKIGEFYKLFLTKAKPNTRIASMVSAGKHDCYLELIGTSNGYTQKTPGALDKFTTNTAGKAVKLYIWFRPENARALMTAAAPALNAVGSK